MAEYNNQSERLSATTEVSRPFVVPELCNVAAISLLVLFGELLVLVLLFAGGPVTWVRFALMSLFVQWVALTSAGVLCATRNLLARFGLVAGALLAFVIVMTITAFVGIFADRMFAAPDVAINWSTIFGQQVIAGDKARLALH